jgi:hypothetical protein
MTNTSDEAQEQGTDEQGISDDQLPEDLQAGEENPLAEPLDDDVDTDELDMRGGKGAEEWDDEDLED